MFEIPAAPNSSCSRSIASLTCFKSVTCLAYCEACYHRILTRQRACNELYLQCTTSRLQSLLESRARTEQLTGYMHESHSTHYQSAITSLYLTVTENCQTALYEQVSHSYAIHGSLNDADALMGRSAWTRQVRHREQAPEGRTAGR